MLNLTAHEAGPLVELLRTEGGPQKFLARLQAVVLQSIAHDRHAGGMQVMTTAEVKRRSEICLKWFKILRADMGYSVDRALDFMQYALQKELKGEPFEPPAKDAAWAPSVVTQ